MVLITDIIGDATLPTFLKTKDKLAVAPAKINDTTTAISVLKSVFSREK